MTDADDRTPWQIDRDRAERTGKWPESWGPYHRHFANDAVHRDGGPECDQPGTPRRVYVFDPDALDEHEAIVARWAQAQPQPDQVTIPRGDFSALLAAAAILASLPAAPAAEPVRSHLGDLLARYDVRLDVT